MFLFASMVTVEALTEGSLVYKDKVIMSGLGGATLSRDVKPAEPLYLGYPHGPKTSEFVATGAAKHTNIFKMPKFDGEIKASADSFICSDRADAPLGSTYGRPTIAGANAVYDRTGDWLITFEGAGTTITPKGKSGYTVHCPSACTIRFKSDYYRNHLGYFLWDKKKPLWKEPIAGWCSWMAHMQGVKEQDILEAAHFFSTNLRDYGYNVIQIDDGYQRALQFGQDKAGNEPFSTYWTKPNDKFPHGMEWLAHQIKDLGMTPGVWIGYYAPVGLKHSEGYVTDADGKPHKGPWVNYAMNGLVKPAREEAYIDTVREFKRQGWDYFKIDTLRHVLYDNYRQVPNYWKSRGESMEQAYQTLMRETKKAAKNSYVLACWGTIPELAGLADGARIGEDVGPDFDSMRRSAKYSAQFQYLNNVVWRNDPDYMCFRVPIEQARAWATMTFLAGGHLMVSDPVAAYDAEHLDALRRVGPPIFTQPLNVISHAPDPEFMTLNAEKDGSEWTVLARFAWQDLPARTYDAGLRAPYLAFDFWKERFLGSVTEPSFDALPKGSCQVISLRKDLGRPQVLGTNRHLSQGAYELEGVKWNGTRLSGRMKRGPAQAWSLYIYVPAGWTLVLSSVPGRVEGEVLKLTFPISSDPAEWSAEFKPPSQ